MHIAADMEELLHRFTHHPPLTPAQRQVHDDIFAVCRMAAVTLIGLIPGSREASLAITHIEQAMTWAHAAQARWGNDPAMHDATAPAAPAPAPPPPSAFPAAPAATPAPASPSAAMTEPTGTTDDTTPTGDPETATVA